MSVSPDIQLHGGPRRIVALTARALGVTAARATLLADDSPLVVSGSASVDDLVDDALLRAADDVLAGRAVAGPGAWGVPLRSPTGAVVGTLCAAGGTSRLDAGDTAAVLTALAEVLSEQLDLLEQVGRMRRDEAATADLARAIEAGEVRPWYQPIVRLATRELIGFEALARWHRTSGEVEPPASFLGLAEDTGLVTVLDHAILDQAVGDLARWRVRRPELRLSVNFSGVHLDDDGWVDAVHATVTRHGVPPGNLDIELTESARPEDVERGAERLAQLRGLGYAVWFDDFGTGWSELQHLVEIPVDGIKIDRFFAEAWGGRADAVVRALVLAADELGLSTTIEGISRPEYAERAEALGCEYAQGYFWSPPVPRQQVDGLLASADPVLRL